MLQYKNHVPSSVSLIKSPAQACGPHLRFGSDVYRLMTTCTQCQELFIFIMEVSGGRVDFLSMGNAFREQDKAPGLRFF